MTAPVQTATVDTPVAAYRAMVEGWELPDALMGGTRGMRAAAHKWLPQETKEDGEPYQRRLGRTFLHEAYRDGVERLASRPFAKPVQVKGELPEQLQYLIKNADGRGSDLTTFTHGFFREAIHRGLNHALVDLPKNPLRLVPADKDAPRVAPDAPALTPYFRTVSAVDLIGWRGQTRPEQIRFKNCRLDGDGEWGETRVEEIHVYDATTARLFEKRAGDDAFVENSEQAQAVPWGAVPLVTLNLKDPGGMTAAPVLESLAFKNLEHWQSSSDQLNCLRFARLAMLFITGVNDEDAKKMVPGPGARFNTTNSEAKAVFLEHGGKAIELGRQHLQDVEAAMAMLALLPMLQQTGNPTATGKAIDEANVQSNLHAWVRLLEHALEEMFRLAAKLLKVALPEDFSVDVSDAFELSLRASTDLQQLIDSRKAGLISSRVFLEEVKKRGLLSDTVDIELMMEELADETPPLPSFPPLFGNPQPPPKAAAPAAPAPAAGQAA